jgi:hypothetical protein
MCLSRQKVEFGGSVETGHELMFEVIQCNPSTFNKDTTVCQNETSVDLFLKQNIYIKTMSIESFFDDRLEVETKPVGFK